MRNNPNMCWLTLSDDMRSVLQKEADAKALRLSTYIRMLLAEYLNKKEKE